MKRHINYFYESSSSNKDLIKHQNEVLKTIVESL